ncbi:MAG: porin family protein [Flavobacteriaceae bacterium]
MKKVNVLLIVIFSMALTLSAQEIKIGAKAGANLSSLTGDVDGVKSKIGFHAGGMVEIPVSGQFYVQPELLFSAQGYKVDSNDAVGTMNYLSLPVIGKYYVTDNLSIEAGPQIGYLLSANVKIDDDDDDGIIIDQTKLKMSGKKAAAAASSSTKQDTKDYFKSIDFSLGFGLGYKFDLGINVSARYNLGLSNISDDSEESLKTSVFMFSIGYYFL